MLELGSNIRKVLGLTRRKRRGGGRTHDGCLRRGTHGERCFILLLQAGDVSTREGRATESGEGRRGLSGKMGERGTKWREGGGGRIMGVIL